MSKAIEALSSEDSAALATALGAVDAYATADQGDKAETAVQPGDLAVVATSGEYEDLNGKPVLGSAAAQESAVFATAAQGAKADTAVQPTGLTKAAIGLPDVDNTSDANKPVSTATAAALDGKATAAQGAKADTAVQPAGLTKAAVGLPNVDNTSDANKPISTAMAAALSGKASVAVLLAEAERAQAVEQGLDSRLAIVEPLRALVPRFSDRAGDARSLFSTALTGDPLGRPIIATGIAAQVDGVGTVLRIRGEDTDDLGGYVDIAPRIAHPLYSGRAYRLTFRLRRNADPADPANNAVEARWQNLNAGMNHISNVRLGDVLLPRVADGVVTVGFSIGKADGPGTLDYVIPPTAVYGLPVIRVYGNGQETDIVSIDVEDATVGAQAVSGIDGLVLDIANVRDEYAAADAVEASARADAVAGAQAVAEAGDAALGERIDEVYLRDYPEDRDGPIRCGVLVGENGRGFVVDPDTAQPLVQAITIAVAGDRDTGGSSIAWLGGRNGRRAGAFNLLSNAMQIPTIEKRAPVDRDRSAALAPLIVGRNGRSSVTYDDLTCGLRVPTLVRRPSTDRDGGVLHPVIANSARAALAYNEYEGALDAPCIMRRRAQSRDAGNHIWSLVGDRFGRSPIVWDENEDALDIRLNRAARGRVEYHAPSEFLGTHRAFNVRLGKYFRYATVQEADGYVGDVRQWMTGSTMAIGDTADNAVGLVSFIGQSNAGPGSIVERLYADTPAPRHLLATNGFYAYGDTAIAASPAATDFIAMVEPPYAGAQGQSPSAMMAIAAYDLERRDGARRIAPTTIATSWRGSDQLDKFFPATSGRYTHENALEQARRARAAARLYGCTLQHDIVFVQGEAGAVGDYYTTLVSYLDTVVPLYGGNRGSGDAAYKLFLLQTNSPSSGAAYDSSALAQLRVARERFAAGVTTLATSMYDGPLEDQVGADIHGSVLGRMIVQERTALARYYVRRLGTSFHPTWPVVGGMTVSGNVVTVPISLATGALALAIDTDRVAPVANYGFVWNRPGGGGPTITGVAISGTNITITLSAAPASGDTLRYALDNVAPLEGWAGGRGQIYATTSVASPWAARGFNVPTTIRQPLVRFEETLL